MVFDKCFASCLDFTEKKGVLIAGLSNNSVVMINPRKDQFVILKSFVTLSSHPLLTIKFVEGMQRLILTNIANEIILVERKSKKGYTKYKSRLITRVESNATVIHDVKLISLFDNSSSLVALISIDKVRLVWVNNLKEFKIKFLKSFTFANLKNRESIEGSKKLGNEFSTLMIDEDFFRPDIFSKIKKSKKANKKKKSKGKGVGIGINELKLILKKKNQNLMSNAGVCLLGKKYNFTGKRFSLQSQKEDLEWVYLVLTFEEHCLVQLFTLTHDGSFHKKNHWEITLKSSPIWGCFMGKNSLFFLFDNFHVSMLLLNQLDKHTKLFDYGELSGVGRVSHIDPKTPPLSLLRREDTSGRLLCLWSDSLRILQ
jgi:hypothetical protein